MEQLIQLSDRITRMHTGRELQDIMSDRGAAEARGMLHLVLDTLDHCEPMGYLALARELNKKGVNCNGSVDAAWHQGLGFYKNSFAFREQYERIIHTLKHAA